jgi:hypothetical protein
MIFELLDRGSYDPDSPVEQVREQALRIRGEEERGA